MKLLLKILSIIFILTFLVLVLENIYSINREIKLFKKEMEYNSLIFGKIIIKNIEDSISLKNDEYIKEYIDHINNKNFKFNVNLTRSKIFLKNNSKEFLTVFDFKAGKKGKCSIYLPLTFKTYNFNTLVITQPLTPLYEYIKQSILQSILLSLIIFIVFIVLLFILNYSYIARPLQKILLRLDKIASGDFSRYQLLNKKDEFKTLEKTINNMAKQLEDSKNKLEHEYNNRITMLEKLQHIEKLATIGQLSAGLAHELGTPLNVIFGRAQIIRSGTLEKDDIINFSSIICGQAKRMTNIIQQLLNYARPKKGTKIKINVNALLNEVINILRPIADNENIEILFTNNTKNLYANIDNSQIQQVFTNIIINSIQAEEDNGTIKIKTGWEEINRRKYVYISIKDNGTGIEEENIKKIFDPFFTTKEAGKGTGLGLSVAHSIVKEHNGWIEVQSKKNRGTNFIVYLPAENN